MNLLQTIWSVLTTPNMQMANYISSPLIFIEATVTMLLFTTILNIETTKKRKVIYVLTISLLSFITKNFMSEPFGTISNMLTITLSIIFILNVSVSKCIIAIIIQFSIGAIVDNILVKLYSICFTIPYTTMLETPIFRIISSCVFYFTIFVLYLLVKKFNFNITLLDQINKKGKKILLINAIFAIIAIGTQFYISSYYSNCLPISIILLSLLSLIAFTIISFYNLTNTTKLEIANQNLEETRMYNKTLSILYDNIRAFKHDFANIVQTIGRICCY